MRQSARSYLAEPRSRSCRLLGQVGRCPPFREGGHCLMRADSGKQDQADWPNDDELHRVPQAQQNQQVEPPGSAICDEGGEGARGQEVRHGEEHRGYAPFESSAGADGVEEDFGGHVAAQECAGVDAEGPELADHNGGFLSHARRIVGGGACGSGLAACPEERHIKEKSASPPGYDAPATFGRATDHRPRLAPSRRITRDGAS